MSRVEHALAWCGALALAALTGVMLARGLYDWAAADAFCALVFAARAHRRPPPDGDR